MTRLLAVLALLGIAAGFGYWLDGQGLLSLAAAKAQLADLQALAAARPLTFRLAFGALYVACAALSIPGAATVLSLLAGAIFGLAAGTVLVSFASTIGSTLACAGARFLLRETAERRVGPLLGKVNQGLARDGAAYLVALRLVPIFPFFAVNLVMGLTRLPLRTFYWASQLGMLPATLVFVNAGGQLARIESAGDVLSPSVLGALALLGVFPLLAQRALEWRRWSRQLARWPKPRHFDANLVVIGAGAAGLVAAYVAAAAKARVVLVEQAEMGGDCLNRGCVPSKALLRAARLRADAARARDYGLAAAVGPVDLAPVLARVRRAIDRVAPHDSVARYTALGVECVTGTARLVSPWAVAVGERIITARRIVIASGGEPALPPLPSLADVPHVTSDTVWKVATLPPRLAVLGGGPVGCELAQAFQRLGSEVTIVQAGARLLPKEDPAVGALLARRFGTDGIRVLTGTRAERCVPGTAGHVLELRRPDGTSDALTFDLLLVATGRRARTRDLGLEDLGVTLEPDGRIATNEYLQASLPTLYACGDVAGPFQLTHAASHQAWYAAVNALYGGFWRFRADYRVIPWCTFTDPEVARLGMTAAEAEARSIPFEVTEFDLAELDRAIADGENEGFIKVVTAKGSDRILGATLMGPHAGEWLAEMALAMRHGLGLRKVLGTVHSYPTLAEANKAVAGEWQRGHLPSGLLAIAERFNRWQRGG